MTSSYQECKRCDWDYMQEMSFVRRQPWTDDDAGMMFQTCRRCGRISIQHFDSDGGISGVWFLHPDAEVIFRVGSAPSHVMDYVFSEDFLKSRGITRGLFRGYLRSLRDLSGVANVIVDRIKKSTSLDRVQLSMELFRDTLTEYLARGTSDDGEDERRLAVSTLLPLVDLLHETRPLEGTGASARVDLRFTALEILETFLQPTMTRSIPAAETAELEAAIDHLTMVEGSIARLNYLAQNLDEDANVEALVEAKYVYKVFRRRRARLSRPHSDAVWRLMHAMKDVFVLGSPLDPATKTYEALRALLEHQLVESGFFKLAQRNQNGTPCLAFRSPRTGEVLLIPLFYPKLAIYQDEHAARPNAVLDSWVEATARL